MERRTFLKRLMIASAALLTHRLAKAKLPGQKPKEGIAEARVYRALNGAPDQNLNRVIELMGGIHRTIGAEDVVAIKPNVQWWNHGVPNLLAVKALVDAIFNRSGGFYGEVVIVENVHRGKSPWKHAGWSQNFDLNADLA